MPPDPRNEHVPEPIDPTDFPDERTRRGPSEGPPPTAEETSAQWFRVAPAGDGSPDRPNGPVTVADVEAQLEDLSLEVRASGLGDADVRDRQRIVDRYERLLAERNRRIREHDDATEQSLPTRARTLAAALLERLRP